MAINLAQTCADNGGVILNKAKVSGIVHDQNGKVAGVKFVDMESGKEMQLKAKSVINACGILVDDLMAMDSPGHSKMVTPSQGVHLVLDMKFLQSDYAIMVPKTSDGRVLFAVPWHNKVVVGTTDIMRPVPEIEPKPLKEEIDFILKTASLYMDPAPTYADIESVFAGQRPLAAPKHEGKSTKELSRGHKIIVSDIYKEYMASSDKSYEVDRELWRKLYKAFVFNNEELDVLLEDQSLYWNDDKEIVDTFVLKTIKRFEAKNGANQTLLPEFKDEEDQEFARRLFRRAILNCDYYRHLISENTRNWDLDRVAFMDVIIMQCALAEILSFPNIPVSVSLNEYVEIAKVYSTIKSGSFVNGTLDGIVNQLKKEGKLAKN